MASSIREKRPCVWELRIYLGRDPSGKVKHKSTSFRGGKRHVERELARLVAEADAGDGDVILDWGPDTTLNDAVVGWQRNGWDDLSPSTVRRYRSIWKIHVKDDIGRKWIRSLGPYDVECYLRRLKREGQSEATVHVLRPVDVEGSALVVEDRHRLARRAAARCLWKLCYCRVASRRCDREGTICPAAHPGPASGRRCRRARRRAALGRSR